MSNPEEILRLYRTVLDNDIRWHSVNDNDIKVAINNMSQVYKPHPHSLSSTTRRLADYNTVAHRCAYLHKYAPFHTAMVSDILGNILYENQNMFWTLLRFPTSKFKICSLGGGPGSDIVGVIAALSKMFGVFPCSAKVVDVKSDWQNTLRSVVHEMRTGGYGFLGHSFNSKYFDWEYLTADLLDEVDGDVNAAIGNADLVTMIKFVSAAACQSTEIMLKKIFMMLKPGSMVLFIDNAGGGFRQLVSKEAEECNLKYVYGPINYQDYTNEAFNVSRFDHPGCCATTITIHMMQKLQTVQSSIPIRNDSGAKRVFPNKRIKTAVYEPSNKQMQIPYLKVPQPSARQEPEMNGQAGERVLNRVRDKRLIGEVDVSEFKNTVKSHLNSNIPPFSEQPNVRLNKKTECNSEVLARDQSKHKKEIFAKVDSNPTEAYNNDLRYKSATANDNSTSKAQERLSSSLKHNNINSSIVLNSALKANNGQMILNTTTTSGTDNLTIKNRLPSMKSNNTSIANVNSTSTVYNGISKTYNYSNSGIVVNSQPKAINVNPRMNNCGAISNSPKGNIVNSISNGRPIAVTMPNCRSIEQLNAQIKVNEEDAYPTSCNVSDTSHSEKKKGRPLKKNGPISIASAKSSRQDFRNTSIPQETSGCFSSNCCSSCVIS